MVVTSSPFSRTAVVRRFTQPSSLPRPTLSPAAQQFARRSAGGGGAAAFTPRIPPSAAPVAPPPIPKITKVVVIGGKRFTLGGTAAEVARRETELKAQETERQRIIAENIARTKVVRAAEAAKAAVKRGETVTTTSFARAQIFRREVAGIDPIKTELTLSKLKEARVRGLETAIKRLPSREQILRKEAEIISKSKDIQRQTEALERKAASGIVPKAAIINERRRLNEKVSKLNKEVSEFNAEIKATEKKIDIQIKKVKEVKAPEGFVTLVSPRKVTVTKKATTVRTDLPFFVGAETIEQAKTRPAFGGVPDVGFGEELVGGLRAGRKEGEELFAFAGKGLVGEKRFAEFKETGFGKGASAVFGSAIGGPIGVVSPIFARVGAVVQAVVPKETRFEAPITRAFAAGLGSTRDVPVLRGFTAPLKTEVRGGVPTLALGAPEITELGVLTAAIATPKAIQVVSRRIFPTTKPVTPTVGRASRFRLSISERRGVGVRIAKAPARGTFSSFKLSKPGLSAVRTAGGLRGLFKETTRLKPVSIKSIIIRPSVSLKPKESIVKLVKPTDIVVTQEKLVSLGFRGKQFTKKPAKPLGIISRLPKRPTQAILSKLGFKDRPKLGKLPAKPTQDLLSRLGFRGELIKKIKSDITTKPELIVSKEGTVQITKAITKTKKKTKAIEKPVTRAAIRRRGRFQEIEFETRRFALAPKIITDAPTRSAIGFATASASALALVPSLRTLEKPAVAIRTRSDQIIRKAAKPISSFRDALSPRQISGLKTGLASLEAESQITATLSAEGERAITRQAEAFGAAFKTRTAFRVATEAATKPRTKIIPLSPRTVPKPPTRIGPPIPFPTLEFRPKTKITKKKKGKQGYTVQVKAKGKFRKAKKKPLPRNLALRQGALIADNTTSRTFRIKKSKKKTRLQDSGEPSLRKFRKGKGKDTFIEKTAFAIDSRGERKGIPFKGLATLRKHPELRVSKRKRRAKRKAGLIPLAF